MATLVVPVYVRQSGVQNQPVGYAWRGTADYNHENLKLGKQLVGLSARACLACAIGMAEWIVWRLDGMSDFEVPKQMIEAAWAADIDVRYCRIPTVSEFEERKGPVDGVLRTTKVLLENSLRSYNTPSAQNLTGRTIYLYFLARHVMPDKAPFDAWLKAALHRLGALYSRAPDDPKGEPVPRQALETSSNFRKENATSLLADFLGDLQPSTNPYLRSPEELLAAGFERTPYRFP